jgi:molybdate transport system substrate-binding protein
MKTLLLMAGLVLGSAAGGAVHAADITVLATPAIKEAYAEIVPLFERETRHKIVTTWIGTADLAKRLAAGEVFDAVICASNLHQELTDTGKLMAGSRSDVARSAVGVAVKAGAPKPQFGSEDALKKTLLSAKTIGISTGPSGVYLNQLFQRMGVLDEIKAKFKVPAPGGMVSELVAKGDAEIGFQQVAELVNKKGVDYVGALPDRLQGITLFSGGVHSRSNEPEAARALLRFLASPQHDAVLKKHGLQLGTPSPY